MKTKFLAELLLFSILLIGCSSSVNYSEDFKTKTSGKYLFNEDDIITISYDNNDLYMHWRGIKNKPVATDTNVFFVSDLYQKLRFIEHPETNAMYLSVISETNPDSLSYDYLKVADDYKTPSEHLADKNFDKALQGFLAIKQKDSLSDFVNQYKFNRLGYKYFREKKYDDAIGVFIMNTKLHPNSPNVYDSLGQAYLVSGDSLNAYENYKKAYHLNKGNTRAKKYMDAYESKLD